MINHAADEKREELNRLLDLAEQEIAGGRLAEARARFGQMSREQRVAPRALFLRLKALETQETRDVLRPFIKAAVSEHEDPLSRSYLAAAMAILGDREEAERLAPPVEGLSLSVLRVRNEALRYADEASLAAPKPQRNPIVRLLRKALG